jgi:ABC-type nitrate/sulfonate/bicarbonate transport system permease component
MVGVKNGLGLRHQLAKETLSYANVYAGLIVSAISALFLDYALFKILRLGLEFWSGGKA